MLKSAPAPLPRARGATLRRDLSRLRSLGILYDVAAKVYGEGARIEIDAKNRWAIFPVIGFRRGGGRTTSRFGVSDHNALFRLNL